MKVFCLIAFIIIVSSLFLLFIYLDCATAAEEQDLWSEFNLLKDVNHPNVIRLLGVCSGEGKGESKLFFRPRS